MSDEVITTEDQLTDEMGEFVDETQNAPENFENKNEVVEPVLNSRRSDRIKSFFDKYWLYFAAPILVSGLFMCVLYVYDVYPFTHTTMSNYDLLAQICPFFEHFYDVFDGKSSLFYSNAIIGGADVFGTLAYCAVSPFTFLFLLFGRGNVYYAVSFVLPIKLSCVAAAAIFFFKKKFPSVPDHYVLTISILYAFCGYMFVANTYINWVDFLIYMPFVILGFEKLVKGGSMRYFAIAYALMIYTCFSISCFALLIVYLIFMAYAFIMSSGKERVQLIVKMCVALVLAIALTLPITVPSLKAYIQSGRNTGLFENMGNDLDANHLYRKTSYILSDALFTMMTVFYFIKSRFKKKIDWFYLVTIVLLIAPVLIDEVCNLLNFGSYMSYAFRFGFLNAAFSLYMTGLLLSELNPKRLKNKVGSVIATVVFACLTAVVIVFIITYNNAVTEENLFDFSSKFDHSLGGLEVIAPVFGAIAGLLIIAAVFYATRIASIKVMAYMLIAVFAVQVAFYNIHLVKGNKFNPVRYDQYEQIFTSGQFDDAFEQADDEFFDGVVRVKSTLGAGGLPAHKLRLAAGAAEDAKYLELTLAEAADVKLLARSASLTTDCRLDLYSSLTDMLNGNEYLSQTAINENVDELSYRVGAGGTYYLAARSGCVDIYSIEIGENGYETPLGAVLSDTTVVFDPDDILSASDKLSGGVKPVTAEQAEERIVSGYTGQSDYQTMNALYSFYGGTGSLFDRIPLTVADVTYDEQTAVFTVSITADSAGYYYLDNDFTERQGVYYSLLSPTDENMTLLTADKLVNLGYRQTSDGENYVVYLKAENKANLTLNDVVNHFRKLYVTDERLTALKDIASFDGKTYDGKIVLSSAVYGRNYMQLSLPAASVITVVAKSAGTSARLSLYSTERGLPTNLYDGKPINANLVAYTFETSETGVYMLQADSGDACVYEVSIHPLKSSAALKGMLLCGDEITFDQDTVFTETTKIVDGFTVAAKSKYVSDYYRIKDYDAAITNDAPFTTHTSSYSVFSSVIDRANLAATEFFGYGGNNINSIESRNGLFFGDALLGYKYYFLHNDGKSHQSESRSYNSTLKDTQLSYFAAGVNTLVFPNAYYVKSGDLVFDGNYYDNMQKLYGFLGGEGDLFDYYDLKSSDIFYNENTGVYTVWVRTVDEGQWYMEHAFPSEYGVTYSLSTSDPSALKDLGDNVVNFNYHAKMPTSHFYCYLKSTGTEALTPEIIMEYCKGKCLPLSKVRALRDLLYERAADYEVVGGSNYEVNVTTDGDDCYLFMNYVAIDGFNVTVNGKKAQLIDNGLNFMLVKLDAGENNVEIKYSSPYVKLIFVGLLLGVGIIVLLWLLVKKWKKLYAKLVPVIFIAALVLTVAVLGFFFIYPTSLFTVKLVKLLWGLIF